MKRIWTDEILAGAYKGRKFDSTETFLTHSYEDDAEKTLCKRITTDKMCGGAGNPDAPPTCPVCLKRDPRFK